MTNFVAVTMSYPYHHRTPPSDDQQEESIEKITRNSYCGKLKLTFKLWEVPKPANHFATFWMGLSLVSKFFSTWQPTQKCLLLSNLIFFGTNFEQAFTRVCFNKKTDNILFGTVNTNGTPALQFSRRSLFGMNWCATGFGTSMPDISSRKELQNHLLF